MSNEKFTPGPWKFDDLEMKIKGTGDAEGRTIIANVSPKMDFSRGMTTQCANAALIAAAPAMYEALKNLHNAYAWRKVSETPEQTAALDAAYLALKAARGEQQ
jgi:hypothetical protein